MVPVGPGYDPSTKTAIPISSRNVSAGAITANEGRNVTDAVNGATVFTVGLPPLFISMFPRYLVGLGGLMFGSCHAGAATPPPNKTLPHDLQTEAA